MNYLFVVVLFFVVVCRLNNTVHVVVDYCCNETL